MTSRFLLALAALVVACSSDNATPITAPDTAIADTSTATDSGALPDTSVVDTSMAADDGLCGGKTCGEGQICVGGACQCAPPKLFCGTGCTDVQTDPKHCGACDKPCTGMETCSGGKCVAPCPMGQVRCGGACVNTNTDAKHCGGCDKPCAGAESCSGGMCSLVCEFPNKLCGGKCVNIQFDANNCGDCGKVCPSGAKGTANCTSGSCVLTCEAGYANCDDVASNGCEVNTSSADAHCGACFKACAASETCLASKCECKTGTAKCGVTCVDLTKSDTNCGLCGKTCATTETCVSSTCECKTGFTRCGTACVDTKTDNANCGGCGTSCGTGAACSNGKCCPTGQLNCGGTCIDPTRDPANCGMCSMSCSGTTPYCVASACAATCGAGTTACSGLCVDTSSDNSNCGMCGKACPTGEVCSSGACIVGGFPGSLLLNSTQGAKVNTWIGTPNQLWKLCYSKATHASTSAAFHTACDGKGPSVVVARVTTGTTDRTIGGYTGVSWSTLAGWKPDATAFLFSITNDHKHGLISAAGTNAVYHSSSYGPTFGGGHDWYVNSAMSGGYCYFGTTYACRTGFSGTTCQNDFCGTYNTWTINALEVWVK